MVGCLQISSNDSLPYRMQWRSTYIYASCLSCDLFDNMLCFFTRPGPRSYSLQMVRNMTVRKGGTVKTFIEFRVSSHVGTPMSITLTPVSQVSLTFSVHRIKNHKSQEQTITIKSNTDFSTNIYCNYTLNHDWSTIQQLWTSSELTGWLNGMSCWQMHP